MTWGSAALDEEALLQAESLLVSAPGCGWLHMYLILLGLVTTQGMFFSSGTVGVQAKPHVQISSLCSQTLTNQSKSRNCVQYRQAEEEHTTPIGWTLESDVARGKYALG